MSSKLEEIEARREARKAALREAQEEQRAADLEAVDALEVEHGDSNITLLDLPFTPGMPTLVAGRAPTTLEIKRYRDRVKPRKDGKPGDPVAAAEEIASVCRVYPDADTYAQVLEARPGVHIQLGLEVMKLATGRAQEDAKS